VRLYAREYQVLASIAEDCFGPGVRIFHGDKAPPIAHDGNNVAVFGRRWGKELRLPVPGGGARGSYFVDWILARIGQAGDLKEFVAVEVQAIDTTGNYRNERDALLRDDSDVAASTAALNWENVNKRILPQVIYKGHVLRQERLCTRGLYFVTPTTVFEKIVARLGNALRPYHHQPGSITFWHYTLGAATDGRPRPLVLQPRFTTTVDQVALAFTAPGNLPAAGVYESAIRAELHNS
jgi:hypothetical protein